jgi:hypothetical protein
MCFRDEVYFYNRLSHIFDPRRCPWSRFSLALCCRNRLRLQLDLVLGPIEFRTE